MRGLFAVLLVGLSSCGGKAVIDGRSSGAGGAAAAGGPTATGGSGVGGSAGAGATGECSLCGPPGTVEKPAYVFHECTPPLQIGCAAMECSPGVTDCGEGYTCDPWGAAACCWCQAAVPACVFTGPAQGPLPEYLKISPPAGPANQDVTLSIQGFPFYVGALFYLVRVGDSGDLMQMGGTTCSFSVTVPGQPDGTVPVWVSQYGGNDPWVLAGFFDWYSGGYPPACTQPGYPCSADTGPCCQTPDVPMACVAGRCRQP